MVTTLMAKVRTVTKVVTVNITVMFVTVMIVIMTNYDYGDGYD